MSTQISNFKHPIWRCKKYLKWVKRQPCVISGRPADDPHHIKGYSYLFKGVGGTIKPPDWATIPLTRDEHTKLGSQGIGHWEANNGTQIGFLIETLDKAFQGGVLELGVIRD